MKLVESYKLYEGNNLDVLKEMIANCIQVDAIITDPPYGLTNRVPDIFVCSKCTRKLGITAKSSDICPSCGSEIVRQRTTMNSGFMGNKWDASVPSIEFWELVLQVLKPGGHVLSFGGTRNYHRMVVNLEDAGFEIKDQIIWMYGSGFPKSLNISKAIDKAAGAERKIIGKKTEGRYKYGFSEKAKAALGSAQQNYSKGFVSDPSEITESVTPEAIQWEGWGNALKPAFEPIVLARKPLSENNIAKNILKYGTGGLNIDGCRIGNFARFPANVILDEIAGKCLDEQYHKIFKNESIKCILFLLLC